MERLKGRLCSMNKALRLFTALSLCLKYLQQFAETGGPKMQVRTTSAMSSGERAALRFASALEPVPSALHT